MSSNCSKSLCSEKPFSLADLKRQFEAEGQILNEAELEELNEASYSNESETDDIKISATNPVSSATGGNGQAQENLEAIGQLIKKNGLSLDLIDRLGECIADKDDGTEFGLVGVKRHKNGGLQFVDKEAFRQQASVVKELITTFGSNLLKGKSVINISLPVRIFEARSFLQRIPDAWAFAPIFLNRASLCKDPVERFKWVITFVISGLHRGTTQRKPFNPILGETFQARYVDGTQIYLEQISHHPPISAFQVMGPGDQYQLSGYHDFRASFRPNSIVGGQVGPNNIDFPDGTRITYDMPGMILTGILWGDRVFQWSGTIPFEDKKNGLKADIVFNPDKKTGLIRYISAFAWPSSSNPTFVDHIRGEISQTIKGKEQVKVVSKIEGSWIDKITFDGQVYWAKRQYKPFKPMGAPVSEALPSDSQFREDLTALAKNNVEMSQQLKNKLEDLQRHDSKLRKASKKEKDVKRVPSLKLFQGVNDAQTDLVEPCKAQKHGLAH